MLKIKYNVDLKDLEKYPFESSDSGSIFWSNKDFQNIFDTLDKLIKNQKKIIEKLNKNNLGE